MRHALFARVGPVREMEQARQDPRAILSWRQSAVAAARNQQGNQSQDLAGDFRFPHGNRFPSKTSHDTQIDWSIPLGPGGTAPGMSPAKYGFDVFAAPSCTDDFVIFPVNQAPTATQENLVGFRNLYSGTVPVTGICNRAPSSNDDGIRATVYWSYAVSGPGLSAGVATSPALSLDGKKVAFVESVPGSRPHFHVLAWRAGDGVDPSSLQNVSQPRIINTFVTTAPVAGSGTATDMAFGAFGDTLSSPFVDYQNDKAYIGDDTGILVRINDVFCTVNPACFGSTPPQPTLDTTWGSGGFVFVGLGSCLNFGAPANLTGPIRDSVTGNIFVGCADGSLYGFNSTGAALSNSPVQLGDGSPLGAIVDSPIVDSVNGLVYTVTGSDFQTGASSVLVQTRIDLSSPRTAPLGQSQVANLHAGAFNDAYFSNPNPASWTLYVQGYNAGGNLTFLYGVGFDAARNINLGTPPFLDLGIPASECSPMTELLNGATDRLFFSTLAANQQIYGFNINSFPVAPTAQASASGGTTGIVVDNVSPLPQASSIYFGTLGSHNAVKLTQAALQ